VTDALARERRPGRGEGGRAVASLARCVGRQVAEAVGGQVLARQHRDDAAGVQRGGGGDGPDPGVGVGRPHDDGVGLAWQGHVVGIAAEAAQQARVLQTAHGLSHGELLDGHRLPHAARVYASSRITGVRRGQPPDSPAEAGSAPTPLLGVDPDPRLFEKLRTG